MTPLSLNGAGAAGGHLVQAKDITERVRAEEALRIQRDLGLALSRTSRVEEAAALCQANQAQALLAAGADGYLQKPYKAEDLLAGVRKALDSA